MRIVILGLSYTSSWGNGHATTYRALVSGLHARGHDVLFLERDVPWYASNRDLTASPDARIALYASTAELKRLHTTSIAHADLVIVGSYVPDGIVVADLVLQVARGVTAFYDIDTPVTLAAIEHDRSPHLARRQMPQFDLYLSFTGGATLERLAAHFGVQRARPLYCSVDPAHYGKDALVVPDYHLGYLGTYSADRQPSVERLLLEPAARWPQGRFILAGPQYPLAMTMPANVVHVSHVPPPQHRRFYNRQRFTLNITRADMMAAGHSPSVRLFEAAACGTPIISDSWPGHEEFFTPGREMLVADTADDVLAYLLDLSETERVLIGLRARQRVLGAHTSVHRAVELERYVAEVTGEWHVAATPLAAAP